MTGATLRPAGPARHLGPVVDRPRRPVLAPRTVVISVVGLACITALCLVSLAIGAKSLTLSEVWHGLLAHDETRASIIVWQLRMPRTLLAIVVGCALAVAGVLMQALTRNPLAEPGLLGVNAGAALAVVVGMSVLGATTLANYVWFAFLGAAAAAVFVYAVSVRRAQRKDHARLVLAGAALSASLSSCTGVITMFDSETFNSYRFWVIGSVADRDAEVVAQVTPFILGAVIIALVSAPSLNALALGEEQATALGASLPRARALTFLAITVLCGAATAAAGPIGFVGLAVPHLLRLVVGVDHRVLVLLAAIGGPVLVLAADIVGRVVTRPGELEVGIVTAFIGGPVLLALLALRRAR